MRVYLRGIITLTDICSTWQWNQSTWWWSTEY